MPDVGPIAAIVERERATAAAHAAPTAPDTAAAAMPPEPVWRRFVIAFIAVFFGGLGSIYAALLLIDPYDTGRFPTVIKSGVADGNPRTAAASHGRDPRFDAAVI